jgi:3-dehydroquinate dehydratase I
MTNAHPISIGHLQLGNIPRVVGTTITRQALRELASGARDPHCDIVELRLDLMDPAPDDGWLDDARSLQQRATPVLVTMRAEFEGGHAAGDAERRSVLLQAQVACACIDIESRSVICAALCDAALERERPIIVSYHDFKATPDVARLTDVLHSMCTHPNVIPKIATMVNTPEDMATLSQVAALDLGRPKCLIGMGPVGVSTRLDLATQGSALAYGFLDASGAPGQIACGDMQRHFASL